MIAVIFSLVIVPVLQNQQAAAFFERQAEKQAKQEAGSLKLETATDLKTQLTGAWDPHQDPLANAQIANQQITNQQETPRNPQSAIHTTQSDTTTDTDNDGLSDELEAEIGSDPTLVDTDGDSLADGVEVKLGTSPTNPDSEGDGIRDNIEIQGFADAVGRRWYLNPRQADTNGDGRDDGSECPPLKNVVGRDADAVVACDSDGDGTPDPFDLDDDNDGVVDQADVTPVGSLGSDGKTYNPANPRSFDGTKPFSLKVSNLLAGKPAFVDLQLRPVDVKHLTYAMNVLDWSSTDHDGQVQHAKNTTFATGNAAGSQADPRLAYGDMRLIPMLELEINGDSVPLSLTIPAINVAVRGAISATVHLEQNVADSTRTDLRFTFADTAQLYTVKIYAGTCPATGTAIADTTLSVADGATATIAPANLRLTDLADGQHVFTITGGGKTACQPIGNIINGPYRDKMIDPAPLQPYGVSVREKNAGGTLLAYIPLNVVSDPTGGANVAFSARMIYWPAAGDAWQQAQQVRVAWLVQMLTDQCDMTGFTPSAAAEEDAAQYSAERAGWCIGHRTADASQVVQTYDEAWYLTGLAARADLGLDMAVAWEAPASDNDRAADDRLWQLARGLLNSFVIGRDEDGNNARDIGVAARNGADETLQVRFDAGGSVPDGDDRRWGIPKNALNVKTFSYPHEDYVGLLASQETRAILQDNFGGYRPITPTLLFAREETFVAVNLADATDIVAAAVTLDFTGRDSSTFASVSWSPYRYNTGAGPDGKAIGWETYPLSEYWDKLEVQFTDAFRNLPREQNRYGTSEAAIIGEMLMARGLFLALNQGVTNLVQLGSNNAGVQIDVLLLWQPSGDAETDTGIAQGVGGIIAGSYTIIADFVTDFVDAFAASWTATMAANVRLTAAQVALKTNTVLTYSNQEAFLKAQGEGFRGIKTSWLDVFNLNSLFVTLNNVQSSGARVALGAGSIATFAIGAAAVVGCIAAAAQRGGDPLVIIGYAITAIGIIVTVKGTIDAIKKAASVLSGVSQATTVANTLKSTTGKVAIAGLIIGAVVTWAVFAVQASLSDLSYQQMGNLVAQTIGQTIVLVIMFIIGLIPIVGAIIQGIITLIDTLISTLCAIFGLSGEEAGDTDPYNDAGDWLCGGIEGLVGTLLGWFIFASNTMMDMSAEGRLAFDELSANQLVHPELGLTTGNQLKVGVSLTNTISLIDVPKDNVGRAYWYQYDGEALRSSSFAYEMQTAEADLHDDLDRSDMTGDWQDAGGDAAIYRVVPTIDVTLPEAGINRTLEVMLTEGYAIPVQNCYVGVCVVETTRDSSHMPLNESLIFDIFPATLDGFYDLVSLPEGGVALSWGQDGDIRFPRLLDADGDGLPYTADPNDALWDSDLDGLGDGYELQIGSNPANPDSDGDGLSDYLEVRAGTDPNRKDTDGDGLWDGVEVYHPDIFDQDGDFDTAEWVGGWIFYYQVNADGTRSGAWVTSDPLKVDSDSDGLTDAQEQLYGFNPNVWSSSQVLTFDTQVQEEAARGYAQTDGFVKPGDTLYYSATLRNELLNRTMQGLLSTDFPPAQNAGALLPRAFILQPTQAQTISGTVGVSAAAATGVYSLTQSAGALVTDWSVLAKGVKLWLPMEDPATADRSGSVPTNDATCTGACPSVTGGRYGGALSLDGSSYLTSPADPSETQYAVSLWFKTSTANGALYTVNVVNGVKVYLNGGNVCANLPSGGAYNSICGTSNAADDRWHHVVHTYGGEAGGQKLYLDGVLVASSTRTTTDATTAGVFIGHAQTTQPNFTGLIDDVRLYDSGLTAAQVRGLFGRPVFDMKFESPATTADGYRWTDQSTFGITGQCRGANCPAATTGILGQGLAFDGQNRYISVGPNANLDLSEGHFTLAAWIKPNVTVADTAACLDYVYEGINATCATFQPEGILGWQSSESGAYATLQRQVVYHTDANPYLSGLYNRLRFGFATASGWAGYYESPRGVLTEGAWNHVALTFGEGAVTLYVNGELRDVNTAVFAGKTPAATQTFEIGQTNRRGKVTFLGTQVWHQHDSGQMTGEAELCMALDGSEILNQGVDAGSTITMSTVAVFTDTTTLTIWEDDASPRCGGSRNGDDQAIKSYTFSITDPGISANGPTGCTYGAQCFSFDGDVMGYLDYRYEHESLPFRGALDEVQIYRQILDAAAVKSLYDSLNMALHLPLDEPPGETAFADASANARNGSCTGAACPVTGVAGRLSQAAAFTAAERGRGGARGALECRRLIGGGHGHGRDGAHPHGGGRLAGGGRRLRSGGRRGRQPGRALDGRQRLAGPGKRRRRRRSQQHRPGVGQRWQSVVCGLGALAPRAGNDASRRGYHAPHVLDDAKYSASTAPW